jgi:hypothetical protein
VLSVAGFFMTFLKLPKLGALIPKVNRNFIRTG